LSSGEQQQLNGRFDLPATPAETKLPRKEKKSFAKSSTASPKYCVFFLNRFYFQSEIWFLAKVSEERGMDHLDAKDMLTADPN
jgi:hypothetical protein